MTMTIKMRMLMITLMERVTYHDYWDDDDGDDDDGEDDVDDDLGGEG